MCQTLTTRARFTPARAATLVLTALLAFAIPASAQSQDQSDDKAPAGGAPQGPPPATVRIAPAQLQNLEDHWDVIGQLREVRRSTVAAETSGRIVAVEVEEGQKVQAGQTVLVRIDDVWSKLAVETAEAGLKEAQATVLAAEADADVAARDLTRLQTLLTENSAKPKEVDDARAKAQSTKAALERARAGVLSAQAAVDRAKAEASRVQVKAPFDGYVNTKLVEVGQWVAQGSPVMEVVSRGTIDAEVDVPERLINFVKVGQVLSVSIEPLKMEIDGKVRAILPVGSAAARTFPVRVSLDDHDGTLRSAMSVLARVPTGDKAQVLTVARSAVVRQPTGSMVWVVVNGTALPAWVEVLFGHEDRLAVKAAADKGGVPLAPDMPVVIEGGERLWPTRPVVIMNGPAPAPSTTPAPAH